MKPKAKLFPGMKAARSELAQGLLHSRRYFRHLAPEFAKFLIASSILVMSRAIRDCETLDGCLKDRDQPCVFLKSCSFTHERAWNAVRCQAWAEMRSLLRVFPEKNPSPNGDHEGLASVMLIRENLRDGLTPEQTLFHLGKTLMSKGLFTCPWFLESLGETVKKHRSSPARHSITTSILRSWLPLRLWECKPDGKEAHRRFVYSATLGWQRNIPASEIEEFSTWQRAWRNIRTKHLRWEYVLTQGD